jgi:hypothetical protein
MRSTLGWGGSASKPTDSKGAAAGALVPEFSFAPMVCGLVVLVSSMLGGQTIIDVVVQVSAVAIYSLV